MTLLTVSVAGIPIPQGSTSRSSSGRSYHTNAATLLPWRAAVIASIRQQMERAGEWPHEGPVQIDVTFHLPRPKSATKRMWPDKRPDLDRLIRAVGDSLTQSGAIQDDGQIVLIAARKEWGPPGMDLRLRTLEQPVRRTA